MAAAALVSVSSFFGFVSFPTEGTLVRSGWLTANRDRRLNSYRASVDYAESAGAEGMMILELDPISE